MCSSFSVDTGPSISIQNILGNVTDLFLKTFGNRIRSDSSYGGELNQIIHFEDISKIFLLFKT